MARCVNSVSTSMQTSLQECDGTLSLNAPYREEQRKYSGSLFPSCFSSYFLFFFWGYWRKSYSINESKKKKLPFFSRSAFRTKKKKEKARKQVLKRDGTIRIQKKKKGEEKDDCTLNAKEENAEKKKKRTHSIMHRIKPSKQNK